MSEERASAKRKLHPDHFVAYADVLGFRQLVLVHETPHAENLERKRRLGTGKFDRLSTMFTPLRDVFHAFHTQIEKALENVPWTKPLSMLVFSDSLFLATTHWEDCTWFCEALMQNCITAHVPLRIGIGYGSFVSHSFSAETTEELRIVSTQFLGKGVVYATDAEKALKGMRIALHPTAVVPLKKLNVHPDKFLELPETQVSDNASHEWNYLTHAYQMADNPELAVSDQDFELRVHLATMTRDAPQIPEVQIHYSETQNALDRMVNARDRWSEGM